MTRASDEFPTEEQGFGPFFRDLYGEDWRRISGYEITVTASDFPTMAHLMHHLRAFKSIGEARRNGHSGPVETGVFFPRIRGHRHRVVII